jgi:uncharacterized protein
MKLDDQLQTRFKCPKCKHQGAKTRRFAATGAGFSRFIDIQHNVFLAVSCKHCGFTEVYDPRVIEGSSNLMNILDFILER